MLAEGVDELTEELRELASLVREHVRRELDLGGGGLPAVGAVGAARAAVETPRTPDPSPSRAAVPSAGPPELPRAARAERAGDGPRRLALLAAEAAACTACRLHEGRTKSVFSRGDPAAPLVFVGEGPGYHEDQKGAPFVGKAGQLLDRMIAAMGFAQDEVYICNVVKCRPPQNRTPNPDEAAACRRFLDGQLEVVEPQVIVALGRCAAENLGAAEAGRRWRGEWRAYRGIPLLSTYHPAYLLRNPEQKRPVWEDLQSVVRRMGRTLPPRRGRA